MRHHGVAMKKVRNKLLALGFGTALALIVGEVFLRIYNPIPMPLRGKRIVLPVNKRFVMRTDGGKVDELIKWTMNSHGFRGPPPPPDFDKQLTFIAVGGSTTECRFLSDGKDWPAQLAARLSEHFDGVWVNNAGLDGHSTFGHKVLLDQVILGMKPDYVVLLVGVNDVGRDDLNEFDVTLAPAQPTLRDRLVEASELLSTLVVVRRSLKAFDLGVQHIWMLDMAKTETAAVSTQAIAAAVETHERRFVPAYERRLDLLVQSILQAGSTPILVTQPALYGDGVDPATGVELAPLVYSGETIAQRWAVLKRYNAATKRVASNHGLLAVDLGDALPKDSSLYVDWIHYSNAGAERVGAIIANAVVPYVRKRSAAKAR